MREEFRITDIYPNRVDPDVMRELAVLCPETQGQRVFDCRVAGDDPRLSQLLASLGKRGLRARSHFEMGTPETYTLYIDRVYERAELDAAPYLVPVPKACMAVLAERSEEGVLRVAAADLRAPHAYLGFVWVWSAWLAVTDQFRQATEDEGLAHAVMRPIEPAGTTRGGRRQWPWELTSDLTLPRLSEACLILDNKGERFDGDLSKGCHLVEDHYLNPELHYAAASLAGVEPFDIALTAERFGNGPRVAVPFTIVSQRFRRFCVAYRLKMDWIPVRVDPG